GLVARGVPVTVVHLMDRLMERQLDGPSAALLARRMAELGVDVLLGRDTREVMGNGRVTGLRFADGEELECDMLVVSVGIRPNVQLARDAGIECERAIVVDDLLRTSDPAIWAVGECAQHRGVVYGLVAPIHEQARTAAAAIAGRAAAPYAGSVPSAALKVMGVDLVAVGDAQAEGGCTVADPERGVYRRLVVREGRAVGAILMGDPAGAEALQALVCAGEEVADPLSALAAARAADVCDLPDDATVCSCHGVTRGAIVQAIRERGLRAPSEVHACTRA